MVVALHHLKQKVERTKFPTKLLPDIVSTRLLFPGAKTIIANPTTNIISEIVRYRSDGCWKKLYLLSLKIFSNHLMPKSIITRGVKVSASPLKYNDINTMNKTCHHL